MTTEAIVFDMDGVLIDSEPTQLRSYNNILREFDKEISMEEFKKQYVGRADVTICEMMVSDYHLGISPQQFVERKRTEYAEMLEKGDVEAIKGVRAAVEAAYNTGLPLSIASSSTRKEIEHVVGMLGMKQFFKHVVSAHEVEHKKPAPDVYLEAAKRMSVNPAACVAIEDSPTGLQSAKSAGMTCIAVTNTYAESDLAKADEITDREGLSATLLKVIQ